jgi:hypothetical protein
MMKMIPAAGMALIAGTLTAGAFSTRPAGGAS